MDEDAYNISKIMFVLTIILDMLLVYSSPYAEQNHNLFGLAMLGLIPCSFVSYIITMVFYDIIIKCFDIIKKKQETN